MAAGSTHPADALMAWARSEGTDAVVQTLVRPAYDPSNPADNAPVATDWPLKGVEMAGGVVQTRGGLQTSVPRLAIAAGDRPLSLDTSSRVRLDGGSRVLQVQKVRVRRVGGRDALVVLELAG